MLYLTESEIRKRIRMIFENSSYLVKNELRDFNAYRDYILKYTIGPKSKFPLELEDDDKAILIENDSISQGYKVLFEKYIQPLRKYVENECKKIYNIETVPNRNKNNLSVKTESISNLIKNSLYEERKAIQKGYIKYKKNPVPAYKHLLKGIENFINNGWGCETKIEENIEKLNKLNDKHPYPFHDEIISYATNIINKINEVRNDLNNDKEIQALIETLKELTNTRYIIKKNDKKDKQNNEQDKGQSASNLTSITNQTINKLEKHPLPLPPGITEKATDVILHRRKMNSTKYIVHIERDLNKEYITSENTCANLFNYLPIENDKDKATIGKKLRTLLNNLERKAVKTDKDGNFIFNNNTLYKILITYRICAIYYAEYDKTSNDTYYGDNEILEKVKKILNGTTLKKYFDVPNFMTAEANNFLNNKENLAAYKELLDIKEKYGKKYILYANFGENKNEKIDALLIRYNNSLKTGENGLNIDNNYPFNLLNNYLRYVGKLPNGFESNNLSRYNIELMYELINSPQISQLSQPVFNFGNGHISYDSAKHSIDRTAIQKGISINTNTANTNNEKNQFILSINNIKEYQELLNRIENMPPIQKEATIFAFAMLDNNIKDPNDIPSAIDVNGNLLQKTITDNSIIKNAFRNNPLLKPYRKANIINIDKMPNIKNVLERIKKNTIGKSKTFKDAVLLAYVINIYAIPENNIYNCQFLYNGEPISIPDINLIRKGNELKYQEGLSECKIYDPISELSEFHSWMHRLDEVKGARPTFWLD